MGTELVSSCRASASKVAVLDGLDSLEIELVLQGEGLLVALVKVLLPSLVNSIRDHQLNLGDLRQVVLLVSHEANNVLVAALTER